MAETVVSWSSISIGTEGNVILGDEAMEVAGSVAVQNVAIGRKTMAFMTEGVLNTAIGEQALEEGTMASSNVAVGATTLRQATGNNNTAIGNSAIATLTEGANNVGVGFGVNIGNKSSNCTVVGSGAELGEKSEGSIAIGGGHSGEQKEKLYIHNKPSATPLIKGDFSAESLTINGTLTAEKLLTAKEGLKVEGTLTLPAESVTTAAIAKEAVTNEKIKAAAGIEESKLSLPGVVKTTGTQTVGGEKKFTATSTVFEGAQFKGGIAVEGSGLTTKVITGLEALEVTGNTGLIISSRYQATRNSTGIEIGAGASAIITPETNNLWMKPTEAGAEISRVQFREAAPKIGELLYIFNNSTFKLTIVNETAEAGTGKFVLGGNLIIEAKAIETFIYTERWRRVLAPDFPAGLTVAGTLTFPNESVKQNFIQTSLTTMQTPVRELAQF